MEADAKSFLCCLRSEPFAPMLKRKAPADLDARRKRKLGRWNVQADKAYELVRGLALGSPETPTSFFDEQLATVGHCVTFSTGERRRKERHDPWVRVYSGKRLTVCEPPLAQPKALCLYFD